MKILLLLILSLAFGGCGRPRERVEKVDQLLATIPDSGMRARWRAADEKGQLPDFKALPVPDRRVTTRAVPPAESPPPRGKPGVPQGSIADVRPYSTEAIDAYDGPMQVVSASAGKLVGQLQGHRAPFELHYALPGKQKGNAVPLPDSAIHLTFRDDVSSGSLHREVQLRNDRVPILLYLSDGGMKPYVRRWQELPLSVRQQALGPDSVALVTIEYVGRRFDLRPGDIRRVKDSAGEVEIFLGESYVAKPGITPVLGGDAYHIRLLLYRVGVADQP